MDLLSKTSRLKIILKGGLHTTAKHPLTGKALDRVLVSSMFAMENMACLNAYSTGLNRQALDNLLHDFWKIGDKEAALEIMDNLAKRNRNHNLRVMYRAYEAEDYPDYLKFKLKEDDEELVKRYIAYLDRLFEVVPRLLRLEVFKDYEEVKRLMDSGWNLALAAFLARTCYDYGFFTKKELIIQLNRFYEQLQLHCSTWEEYTKSYILGRSLEGWPHLENSILKAEKLHTAKRSPLKGKTKL